MGAAALSKMKPGALVLVHKRLESPKDAEHGADKVLLQRSQRVESRGPGLVAIDSFMAIHDLLATAPDIAFVDIGLPGIDGHVGRRLRAALGRRVPLMALTAYGREQNRRRSSQAGFDVHLLKPASYEDPARILARAAGGES